MGKDRLLGMKKILKLELDEAAYFALHGAIMLAKDGEYHRGKFTMEIPEGMYEEIKKQPLVNYRDYMKKRKKLKEKVKKIFYINPKNSHKSNREKQIRLNKS